MTTRRLSLLVLSAALISLGMATVPRPADAALGDAAQAVEVGGGTISPGLTTTPTYQSMSFSGSAAVAVTIGQVRITGGAMNCSFSGTSSIAETTMQSQGGGTYVCSGAGEAATLPGGTVLPASISLSCPLSYVRVGTLVATQGNGTITVTTSAGTTGYTGTLFGWFDFIPTSNPTTTYQQEGEWTIVGH